MRRLCLSRYGCTGNVLRSRKKCKISSGASQTLWHPLISLINPLQRVLQNPLILGHTMKSIWKRKLAELDDVLKPSWLQFQVLKITVVWKLWLSVEINFRQPVIDFAMNILSEYLRTNIVRLSVEFRILLTDEKRFLNWTVQLNCLSIQLSRRE